MSTEPGQRKPKMRFKFYVAERRWRSNLLASEALERREKMRSIILKGANLPKDLAKEGKLIFGQEVSLDV